jgi:NADH:ubiquinone oxidoreductase subunit 4 (subunit M)
VILAGVILKVATYGVIRYILPLEYNMEILPRVLAIISILYSSLLALSSPIDFKKIIAYSSIIHMNISLLGLLSYDEGGLLGGTMVILSHG